MSETQTPPAAPTKPWYEGQADQETLGFWQNKGWDTTNPAAVAIAATKAYHEAQKFVGAPPDSLVRLPKDMSDEAGWKALWTRLGAPGDAAGYDFTKVARTDGQPPDAKLVDFMREHAVKLNLPKDTAAALTQSLVSMLETRDGAAAADRAAALVNEKTTLAKNWGANQDANLFVAKRAAQALGVTPEAVAALEGQVGYAKVMEMFHNIGTKIGEDKFVTGGPSGNPGVMSVAQAHDRLRELKADTAFVKRYMEGGSAEAREMTALHTIIASGM